MSGLRTKTRQAICNNLVASRFTQHLAKNRNFIQKSCFTSRSHLAQLQNSKISESSTDNQKTSESNIFKAPIDVDDSRSSPFNLPLDVKRRIAELAKLRDFIPGDIYPPTHIEAKSSRQIINQALDDTVDKEKNAQRRKVLARQIITPYYQDFHDIRNTNGKLFEALDRDVSEKSAHYMPNFMATPLSPHLNKHTNPQSGKVEIMDQLKGKLSLVAFCPSQFAENQLSTFITHYRSLVEKSHKRQLIEVNVAEKFIKSLIVRLFASRIRAQLPEAQQATYFLKYGSIQPLRERLAMVNGMIGYVFLVDPQLRIRWYANGKATDKELATLTSLTERLTPKSK